MTPEKSVFSNSRLELPVGCVHVWQLELKELTETIPGTQILSPDELARANRFRFEKDRSRFVRCRSVLRILLGRYLQTPPNEISFAYHCNGKPDLAVEHNQVCLRFNVSHSASVALLAFAVGHAVGVDIEQVRGDLEVSTLIQRFFSAREREELLALPDELQILAFFACWTRKEAVIKATGHGLALPLTAFSVTTHPDVDPQLEEFGGDVNPTKHWFLTDLSAPTGYRAALAVQGTTSAVHHRSGGCHQLDAESLCQLQELITEEYSVASMPQPILA
jgi:4'-phosphopantetheinyl transferase